MIRNSYLARLDSAYQGDYILTDNRGLGPPPLVGGVTKVQGVWSIFFISALDNPYQGGCKVLDNRGLGPPPEVGGVPKSQGV